MFYLKSARNHFPEEKSYQSPYDCKFLRGFIYIKIKIKNNFNQLSKPFWQAKINRGREGNSVRVSCTSLINNDPEWGTIIARAN